MMFDYIWNKTDLDKVEKNGLKVFSTFACGGGSSFGYKMSGFEVVAANEIDPMMAWHYKKNHTPKHFFLMPIQELIKRDDIPKELFGIDILDGSPPCSNFSMAGNREKDWGKEKVFREGQAKQVLDDLFFSFIDLARIIRPKVIIAENVVGIITGKAKGYVKQILKELNDIGYKTNIFKLNASFMGLPQARNRIFFISQLKENYKNIKLEFNEKQISVEMAFSRIDTSKEEKKYLTEKFKDIWHKCEEGKSFSSVSCNKNSYFSLIKLKRDNPCSSISATSHNMNHYNEPRQLTLKEIVCLSSFPQDYVYKTESLFKYLCGMSVPPIMMNRISDQVYKQIFNV